MKRTLLILVVAILLFPPSIGFTATLSGTVIEDASGAPVDASLIAYKKNVDGGWDFTGAEDVDAAGKFSFNYLEAGTYYIKTEAFADCDPSGYYCADMYLPQIYDNIPQWDPEHKTEIVLQDGDVRELPSIRIQTRPFYFDTVPMTPVMLPAAGGSVKVTGKVMSDNYNSLLATIKNPA